MLRPLHRPCGPRLPTPRRYAASGSTSRGSRARAGRPTAQPRRGCHRCPSPARSRRSTSPARPRRRLPRPRGPAACQVGSGARAARSGLGCAPRAPPRPGASAGRQGARGGGTPAPRAAPRSAAGCSARASGAALARQGARPSRTSSWARRNPPRGPGCRSRAAGCGRRGLASRPPPAPRRAGRPRGTSQWPPRGAPQRRCRALPKRPAPTRGERHYPLVARRGRAPPGAGAGPTPRSTRPESRWRTCSRRASAAPSPRGPGRPASQARVSRRPRAAWRPRRGQPPSRARHTLAEAPPSSSGSPPSLRPRGPLPARGAWACPRSAHGGHRAA
mmetsp:Transcript_100207/g.323281  ORF Transcript_100207/g.323281 Transcript_100207/m.323281 type:complete len:332 (-) Transcript_100207:686-1681(-)